MFALRASLIGTRSTNRIDIEYFKYLPFTQVFASADKLHATLFPVFAHPNQHFVAGLELKSALREMADYYDTLSEQEKKLGSMSYADYPPAHLDNAVNRIFDSRFQGWRNGANAPRPPRDNSGDAALLKELKEKFDFLRQNAK